MARKNYVNSTAKADVLVHPDLDGYSSFDFENSATMIELGYETAKSLIADIRVSLAEKSKLRNRIARRFHRA